MMPHGLVRCSTIGALIVLAGAACSGDTTTPDIQPPQGTEVEQPDPGQSVPDPEQDISDEEEAGPPTGLPLLAGLAPLEVLGPPVSGAGTVPLFSWEPVDGTAQYELVVLGPGGPIWGWRGVETEIRLGGLPFERPAGMRGPVIAVDTCWSVIALDPDGHVVAASEFLAVSPAESDGHICVPGSGADQAP